MTTATRHKYRVWFTPNPPRKAFTVEVDNLELAMFADALLSGYSLYLGDDLIPVSAGGIEQWDATSDDWEDIDMSEGWDEDATDAIRSRIFETFGTS